MLNIDVANGQLRIYAGPLVRGVGTVSGMNPVASPDRSALPDHREEDETVLM